MHILYVMTILNSHALTMTTSKFYYYYRKLLPLPLYQ